jgi:hypothetical protein
MSQGEGQARGIPTSYRGYQMRSRTEARWAAMFDLLGWSWEYEPFDGDGYIPDFVLMGAEPVLVEVKPGVLLDELEPHASKVLSGIKEFWRHDVLIVGSGPFPVNNVTDVTDTYADWHPAMGLLYEYVPEFKFSTTQPEFYYNGTAHWITCLACQATSFVHNEACYRSRICGHYDGDNYKGDPGRVALEAAWAEASNRVRWPPPGPSR